MRIFILITVTKLKGSKTRRKVMTVVFKVHYSNIIQINKTFNKSAPRNTRVAC